MIPVEDRIVVRPDVPADWERGAGGESRHASGLVIPTELLQREDNPTSGVVVAAGPGRVEAGLRIPMEVIVGDRIFYSQYVTAVDYGDERLVTMRANAKDVLWVEERGS